MVFLEVNSRIHKNRVLPPSSFLCLLLIFLSTSIKAQPSSLERSDTTFSLNLPQVPSSPAFTILGIEPVSIERPATPTDLAVCILHSTNNLISLPKNFALEFTPRWFFDTDSITYERYSKFFNPLYVFPQTFSVSMATYTDTTVSADSFTTSFSLGFRFSVFRGRFDKKYVDTIDTHLATINRFVNEEWDSLKNNDSTRLALSSMENALDSQRKRLFDKLNSTSNEDSIKLLKEAIKVVEDSIELVGNKIKERDSLIILELEEGDKYKIKLDSLHKLIEESIEALQRKRIGFKCNFALAGACDFPQGSFNNHSITKVGVWTDLGYERPNWGAFATARGMYYKNLDRDSFSVDAGGRVLWDFPKKITLSAEVLGRYYGPGTVHLRWDINVDYRLPKNNIISFTVGKGYGQGMFEQGELIASINFKQGFGSMRPVLALTGKTEETTK